ncbi:MAG: HEAT repeat domain-containing protein [Pirellulales bacterium]
MRVDANVIVVTIARIVCLVLACIPIVARGDVFLLNSGGQVEGELVNRDEVPRVNYVVRLESGGEIVLGSRQVSSVVVRNDADRRYEELLPKMPATIEGHWKMAEWCRERSLDTERETHLRAILELDPNHEPARLGLGYTRLQGKWTTNEEYYRELGYVRQGTTWRLPQELAMVTAQDRARKAELEWKSKLRILRGKIGKKGGERALDEIRAIRDPAAAASLIQWLESKDESRDMKFLVIELLGRLGTASAINTLAYHAIYDDDPAMRDKALDYLEKYRSPQLVSSVANRLKDENNLIVNRAAIVLGRFGEPSATMPLIDALTTRHKQTVGGGGSGSITPQFSGEGGAGLSMGGGTKVVQIDLQNDNVLSALALIHGGANFGYDKAAWKRWYAEKQTPRTFDFRRDP